MSDPILIGFDYETELFGPENLAPDPIALSACLQDDPSHRRIDQLDLEDVDSLELATCADRDLEPLIRSLLEAAQDPDTLLVGANVAFDLAVACNQHFDLYPAVFDLLESGKIADIQVREKLLNLADTGDLEYRQAPDGSSRKLDYSLAGLVKDYLGIEVEGKAKTKDGKPPEGDDAWRLNYGLLRDVPLAEWPAEAVDYSVLDSAYPALVYRCQADRAKEIEQRIGSDPLKTEAFRGMVRFSLYLMSKLGVCVDPEEHAKVVEELKEALQPEKLSLLVEAGILRPGRPSEPYANRAKAHVEGCKGKARKTCDCPLKMKAPKKPSINKAKLEEHVLFLKKEYPEAVELRYSEKENLILDKTFMQDHSKLCPVLRQYQDRQAVQKLVTTDLPRMEWPKGSGTPARVLHAGFDFLKETGRTSSFASKSYPSWNCQNPHPRVRPAIVPREGYYFYSVDYSGMELVTLAQRCYDLFGFSVLRDVINSGKDAHAYLGAYLAYFLSDEFHESVDEAHGGQQPSGEELYEAFLACKYSENAEVRKFFKHYRTFAKPTGLGYPGGLGPDTFVEYAHATYKIECSAELAADLREVWLKAFPEMKLYLAWINTSCKDPHHSGKYCYTTRWGMYRAAASYCAAANGAGLQSPSAEGALLAVCEVVRATVANQSSVLYPDSRGDRHNALLFIHDEIIGEARIDCAHEVAHEVARIMVECMSKVTPDVTPSAAPVLMLRWEKAAEAVYDENGRLVPWERGAA